MATAVRTPVIRPCIPSAMNPPLKALHVIDMEGLSRVADFFSRVSVFGLDLETNFTDSFETRRIRTIQVGDRFEQYVIDLLPFALRAGINLQDGLGPPSGTFRGKPHQAFQPILDLLVPVLESKNWLKVGHNLQFEYENLKWSLGIRAWNFYDVLIAEREYWKGLKAYFEKDWWSLEDMTARYLHLAIDKTLQKSYDLETPLTPEQVDYAALDIRLPLGIKKLQYEPLLQANILNAVQIENNAIPAYGDLHLNGLKIRWDDDPELPNPDPENPEYPSWNGMLELNAKEHRVRVADLDKVYVPIVGRKEIPDHDLPAMEAQWKAEKDRDKRKEFRKTFEAARRAVKEAQKHWEEWEGEAAVNYGSNSQMLKVLREKFGHTRLKDTNADTLVKFAGTPEIDTLLAYRETAQLRKNYIKFRDHVNPVTGRIHPEHRQQGTDTGRGSCGDPNVYNLKRGSDWRSCFITDKGWKVLTADLNGAELRIIAEMSGEPLWVEAFNKGWDVHSYSAELIYGEEWKKAADENCAYYHHHGKCKCKEHKRLREAVKAVNFGIAYGMTYKRLVTELSWVGIHITNAEAMEILARWKKTFKVAWAWLEQQAKNSVMYFESRTIANRRRQYKKPSFAAAREKWLDKNKKENRQPTGNEVSKMFGSMTEGIKRQAMNAPVQGTNADLMKIAMGCGFDDSGRPFLWHIMEPEFLARLINFIYDEFVYEAPDETADSAFAAIQDAMFRAGAMLLKKVGMPSEGHVGICWSKG